ncbi:hypothetical protein [Dongia sp.]|uniref:hypothetical protein n=1 Tax=Dongia sp. TaxID=1977262 RepID=UPI0035B2CA58
MRQIVIAILFAASLISPAAAQSTDDAERLADEGLAKILQALDLLLKTIPQYAAPEVLPNGDIIIRRLHPEDEPPQKPKDGDDEPSDGTET